MNTISQRELMNFENQNEIYKAIDTSGLLSKSQKNILKYIVSFDLERGVAALNIMDSMKVSKQAINFSLQQLMKRNFLTRYKDKVFVYKINRNKLSELIEDYRIRQKLK